jgi:hypothetical protein
MVFQKGSNNNSKDGGHGTPTQYCVILHTEHYKLSDPNHSFYVKHS